MPISCPPKHTKEWKDLVIYAGSEERAYKLWIANKFELPKINQLKEEGIKEGPLEEKPFSRFEPLIEKNIQEIERLNKILARKQSDLKLSKDKPKLSKEIHKLRSRIENLEKVNVTLKKNKALESIAKYAEEDLQGVSDVLNRYETEGLTLSELNSTLKTIALWQQSGDFSNDDHLFLTPDELEELDNPDNEVVQEIRTKFLKWKSDADRLYNKYMQISQSLLENEVQKEFGDDIKVELDKRLKDVNILMKNMIDISEVDHQIHKLMSQWVRKANFNAHTEVQEDFKKVENAFDNLKKKNLLNKFINLMQQRQSNADDRKTGDTVFRFTQKWFDKERSIYHRLKRELATSENQIDPGKKRVEQQNAYKKFREEIDKITLTIDSRKLFSAHPLYQEYLTKASEGFPDNNFIFTKEDKNTYITELKKNLGEEGYQAYYEQLEEKLKLYEQDEKAYREHLEDTLEGDLAAIEIAMEEWVLKYNPFWNAHYSIEGHPNKKIGNSWASSSKQYISTIAKKFDEIGVDLGYYDTNFEELMRDSDMKEVYNLITGILNEYVKFLPPHEVQFFHVNTLPNIRKSILESFTKDGMSSGLQSTWNALKESTRTDVFERKTPIDVNEKFVQLDFINDNSSVISEYVTNKSIQYKLANPNATAQDIRNNKLEWTKDIQNELAGQKSWDIERITKAFMLHSSTFKHKSKIEDAMKVSRNMLDELIEQQVNAADQPNYNKTSNRLKWRTKDLEHLKEMTDHFMDNFFGYKTKRIEGKTTKKILTADEKKIKEDLIKTLDSNGKAFSEGQIPEQEFIKNEIALQNQLEKLGGVRVWGNIADNLIKYFQIKGIGWNLFSAFANRGFGKISNIVDAVGGQRFTQKQLTKATFLMQHTILKNYTFNKYNPKITQKIRALMTKLDVLKESKNEIFQQKISNMGKRFKWLSPYNMQSRGEYLNQGEVMIAMMLNTKILVNGEESNVWEAMNDGGTFKEGTSLPENSKFKTLDDLLFNTKSRIDEGIRTLHGNYDYESASLYIKKSVLGRMFAQFRTWAFMGFYDRFGGDTGPEIAGFEKKGRYLSYGTFFKEFGPIQGTIELTKNLARKLIFQNTKFDELISEGVFTETDAANLRKNLQEIVLYGIITGLGLLLRAAVVDDDEEQDPTYKYLATFWINQMGRLQTDILFYTNPVEFEKLQRQALPVFNLVQDASRLLTHGMKLATGQTTDFYDTGIYAHQRKSSRYIKNVFPLLNQINKLESLGNQIR